MKMESVNWWIVGGGIAAIGVIANIVLYHTTDYLIAPQSGCTMGIRSVAAELAWITSPNIFIFIFWHSAPWWVVLGIPVFGLAERLWVHRWAVVNKSKQRISVTAMTLSEAELPRSGASDISDLRVCHLSDIHLSSTHTLEGNLDGEATLQALSEALEWALGHDIDLVLITGDLTDAGEQMEWQALSALLKSFGEKALAKIAFVPGNHDLITLRTKTSRVFKDGNQFDAEEKAAYWFVQYVLKGTGDEWEIATSAGNNRLAEVFSEVEQFLYVYELNKPHLRGLTEFPWKQIIAWWRVPQHIWELTPSYIVTDKLVTAAREWEGTFPWPSRDFFLMKDFLAVAYPQVFYENDSFIVIGLNSCIWRADNLLTSAFGRLGCDQIERLSQLLNKARDKCKLIMLHHHLGLPEYLVNARLFGMDIDLIRLTDGPQLTRVLSEHDKVIIFNGHKHIGYHASMDCGAKVISSASVAYGDKARERSNCYIYRVTPDGEAYVSDETKITAHT